MPRAVARALCVAFAFAAVAMSCGGQQKKSEAPEGHKICKYCCTTANVACSCVVLDVVDCPEPDNTGSLPACAECRNCTKKVSPDESCAVE